MKIYTLPRINFLKLRFHLSAAQDCNLPEWKGSLLRGAFGHALRRTVCTMKAGQDCRDCLLISQCAYTRLFETFTTKPPPRFLNVSQTSPRPFIVEPLDLNQDYKTGDVLWFDLILIGEIINYLPYVVFAIYQMAKSGLGARRYPFSLDKVFCCQDDGDQTIDNSSATCWKELYSGESETLLFNPDPLTINGAAENFLETTTLLLKFLTSTRFVINKKLTKEFDFRALVFKMMRRTLELVHFYMPDQEIEWEFHNLLVAADKVEIVKQNLEWHDYNRYSNRHQMKMKMGGFVGDITLKGDLSPFMELLLYSEVIHVGKGATFGLGKIKFEWLN